MLSPIDLIRRTVDGMIARGFGRVVNITSWTVKAPSDAYGLSTGPRLGLTGFSSGLARTVAARNVTINNLLPGVFETERIDSTIAVQARQLGVSVNELIEQQVRLIPARRMGTPEEFGAACAFLCSAQAGYMTGQNVLLDGGRYTGLF